MTAERCWITDGVCWALVVWVGSIIILGCKWVTVWISDRLTTSSWFKQLLYTLLRSSVRGCWSHCISVQSEDSSYSFLTLSHSFLVIIQYSRWRVGWWPWSTKWWLRSSIISLWGSHAGTAVSWLCSDLVLALIDGVVSQVLSQWWIRIWTTSLMEQTLSDFLVWVHWTLMCCSSHGSFVCRIEWSITSFQRSLYAILVSLKMSSSHFQSSSLSGQVADLLS